MATKYRSAMPVGELTPRQFMILVGHAFSKLGWQYSVTNENVIIAQTEATGSSWGEEITVTVNAPEADVFSKCVRSQLTDWGKNKKNVNLLMANIDLLRSEYTAAQLDDQFNNKQAEGGQESDALYGRPEQAQPAEAINMSIGPGNYVTYSIIAINILVFVAMAVSGVSIFDPTGLDILNWGGNMRAYTATGEWWRLLTCVFVHVGVIHLLLNMYALFSVGLFLEPIMGRWKFLVAYLSTGLLASITSMWWSDERVSAGASGAIFGLYGFFLALLTTNFIDRNTRKSLLQSILIFVVYNLIYGLKGNIDNAAHIGGLASGLVLGYVFYLLHKKGGQTKLFPAVSLGIAVFVSVPVLNMFSDDTMKFDKVWNQFAVLEEKGMQPLQQRDSLSATAFIEQAETISMPAWREIETLLKGTNEYKLPSEVAAQRDLLNRYVDLRIQHTQTWIRLEKEQNISYLPRMDSLSSQIEAIIQSLSQGQSQ